MVGDSLVQYVEWHELLGRGDVLNRGIGGETTADLLDRIGEINSLKPRQIFLLIGTNDVDMQGVTADGVIARYRQIVEGLSRAGAKVVCLSIPMMRYREKNSLISEINQRIKLLEREGSVTYIELNERLAVNGFLSGEYTYDGVHLTGRGYRKIIDLIEMNLM